MSEVVCKLPRAGLGNQLFPLMKAYTFAHLNKLPVRVTGYNQLKIGPYIRGEKTKRKYRGVFTFQKNRISEWWDTSKLKKYKGEKIEEPPVRYLDDINGTNKLYIFSAMPHWEHYFDGLQEHRKIVIELFWKLLTDKVQKKIHDLPAPCIGVHIRMGDFRKLEEGEDFSKLGIVRTPELYFINVINTIRSIHGSELPVSVFTDGFRNEFRGLFKLNNITMIEGNHDIVDLVLLSKSKIIVTSATSTFSYWSAFLSEAIVIMHPDHVNTSIRPKGDSSLLYEGAMAPGNSLLVQSIKKIN